MVISGISLLLTWTYRGPRVSEFQGFRVGGFKIYFYAAYLLGATTLKLLNSLTVKLQNNQLGSYNSLFRFRKYPA